MCKVHYYSYTVCHGWRVAKSCEKKSKIARKVARLKDCASKNTPQVVWLIIKRRSIMTT